MKYVDTWDLDRIFPGGTKSPQLQEKLEEVKALIHTYGSLLTKWDVAGPNTAATLKEILHVQEAITKGLEQADTFVSLTHSAFMNDAHASVAMGQVVQLWSEVEKEQIRFRKKIVAITDTMWEEMLTDETLQQVAFALHEMRRDGKRMLSEQEENIITALNKDGITAWSQLYDTTVSIMTVPFTNEAGETTELSVGQAMNRMYADPDPFVRKQLFDSWEKTWTRFAPVFADTLNHLAGYRLTLQALHNRKDHLEEPLEYNRMSKATLDAMWTAVENKKQPFLDYLQQKAKMLGMEKLGWQDVDAPVVLGDVKPTRFSYDEACDFILTHFSTFGPKLTAFTKHALENRWVEAEDRANKRPGGYCASLPEFEESRIFMTFTGSSNDTSTLAHELGHAFHSDVMKDLPLLNQQYAMNVAETASTFAETIIANATIENAVTDEEKIALLATKLEGATAMFLNIHARFLFENSFYEARKNGIVSEATLNELMEQAQKTAYGDSLDSYHPHFWCSKLHFFIDSVPFYNFPYTFGYLFSLGIYAEYVKQPEGFEEKYIALLRDTATMKVEDLAKKHLGIDITEEAFWEAGIDLIEKDVKEFIRLTEMI